MRANHTTGIALGAVLLMACHPAEPPPATTPDLFDGRTTVHRDGDDLVTAGLGLDGLTGAAPVLADPEAPTASELRRLAIYTSWTALAALNPAGGRGGVYDDLPSVEGREYAAFRTLPGRKHPARVLLQVPDDFNADQPCLVVAPASGSRGVYGAVPMVAPNALAAGCAVVYTDKGAGTDFFDHDQGTGVALSGLRIRPGDEPVGLHPAAAGETDQSGLVSTAHAHSGDHPEADWGAYVLDAIRFGLETLGQTQGGQFTAANTRVIAAGLSNGGGAVLHAAEQDEEQLIDAVVALMPNITAPDTTHLFDYATLAGLYQPCVLGDSEATMAMVLGNPLLVAAGTQRCSGLVAAGLLDEPDPAEARARLLSAGFDADSLELTSVNIALDLWRAVISSYASAYLRRPAQDMPCGYRLTASQASTAQRQAWWATHSGVGAGGGIELEDSLAEGSDRALPGLLCLRQLAEGDSDDALALRAAIDQTRATAELPDIPVLIVHGRHDALIPAALSSRPYVAQASATNARLSYWEVANAQHFDALLAAPAAAERLVPILPYGWYGLDHIMAVLDGREELSPNREIQATPAAQGQPLEWEDLGLGG